MIKIVGDWRRYFWLMSYYFILIFFDSKYRRYITCCACDVRTRVGTYATVSIHTSIASFYFLKRTSKHFFIDYLLLIRIQYRFFGQKYSQPKIFFCIIVHARIGKFMITKQYSHFSSVVIIGTKLKCN